MARQIKLSQIGDYVEGQYEKLLRVAVFETDRRVKEASPVETGRLRVSWQIGENAASGGIKPEGQYSTAITPPDRINYSQEKLGNVYSIHNNLPYAEPLAGGSSKQADAGWVDLVGKEMQSYVRSQYEKIKRQG